MVFSGASKDFDSDAFLARIVTRSLGRRNKYQKLSASFMQMISRLPPNPSCQDLR
jgi:hypothetical protein